MLKPTAEDVIANLQQIINLLGADAFSQNDWIQFYSGPKEQILKKLFGSAASRLTASRKNKSNYRKAERQAKQLSATRIDDTVPGKHTNDLQIYQFFAKAYLPDIAAGFNEADKVMRFLSREFAKATKRHVVTAVCGADQRRVFRDVELPELVANPNIETINRIPAKAIIDLYRSTPANSVEGQAKAFRLICLSELRMALLQTWNDASKVTIRDYLERKDFYHADRGQELLDNGRAVPAIYRQSRNERQKRHAIFFLHVANRDIAPKSIYVPVRKVGGLHF